MARGRRRVGQTGRRYWLARLAREHPNLRAAVEFCLTEPAEADPCLRLALHVWLFYYWSAGHVSEGRYRLGQVLARAGEPTVWRAPGAAAGQFPGCRQRRPRRRRRRCWTQGTGLAGQLNNPATSGVRRLGLGSDVCLFAGDLPHATAHFEDGLAALPAAVRGRQRALLLTCAWLIAAGPGR